MILGLNTDVRHKGKTFHIQTEDSGVSNPVLFTHVFIGGTIIASRKSSYADDLEHPELEKHVRGLMRAQHRAVHEALTAGEFDEASKTARARKKKGAIPLAKKKKGPVGVMPQREPATVSSPPPEDVIEELDSMDLEELEDSIAEKPMTAPPPPPPGALLDPGEVDTLDGTPAEPDAEPLDPEPPEPPEPDVETMPDMEADDGFVEYSTDLVSGRPLDPVMVAWLLEDEQPT